jgi:UDP-N-acetylglucosamine:LPS N-acetylglucosamine transferase
MSEAVDLHVPMLSIPIEHQFEQELNARYLERLGYGTWSRTFHPDIIEDFIRKADDFTHTLGSYERQDNSMTFACVDELIKKRRRKVKRPKHLDAPAMGKWNKQ